MTNSVEETRLARAAAFIVCEFLRVRTGEQVLITADTASDSRAVQALFKAASVQRARVSVITIPQLPYQGKLADPFVAEPAAAAVKSCDVWIDITFPYLTGSGMHAEAMALKRVRALHLLDLDGDGIARLFAGVDFEKLFDLQEALDAFIAASTGKQCHITSPSGTDVTFTIGRPATRKTRRIETPGSYMAPGSAVIYPEVETVRGTLVVDAAFHEYYTLLRNQLTIKVDGRIREVGGGGTELKVMERALKRAGGGQYGSIIHFTHGFHPMARFHGGSLAESIRAAGCDAVGLGTPWWEPGGGENHPDALVSMHSLWVDGGQIVHDGALVAPQFAQLESRLEPAFAQ
jgi:2,5-dihydroxypyridine 5,6-dioxygenase